MGSPKVSTITSFFRGDRFLAKFLSRLPEQTIFDHCEFIIDLNEPSEYALECVRSFQRDHPERLKILISEEVVTYGTSWNRCIEASEAELLAIWNIDDLRTPDSLEVQSRYLANRPDTGLVCGSYYVVNEFGSTDTSNLHVIRDFSNTLAKGGFIFGPFFMFRKTILLKTGVFDEQFQASADYDFGIRTMNRVKSEYLINEPLGFYLNEMRGLSTKSTSRGPVEDTAIALRYGLLDRIDFFQLHRAIVYDMHNLHVGMQRIPIGRNTEKDENRLKASRFPLLLSLRDSLLRAISKRMTKRGS